jgi:hypothetical protein
MSIASKVFLAAALAAGFLLPGGAHAELKGFSIDLGTPADPLMLDYNPNGGLSAEGLPPEDYKVTLTGNYGVVDNLGSLDKTKEVLWQRSYEITLNGHILFFGPPAIIGPESGDDIWQAALFAFNKFTGLPGAGLNVIIGFLEHRDHFNFGNGEFAYAYNTLNQPVGTFAVGTTVDLGQKIALKPEPLTNTLSFDFSVFVVPEPSTWAMLLLGFAGLGFVGYRRTRRAKPQAA